MKKYKFTIKGNQYDVEIKNDINNIIDIEVNGTTFQVEVHKEVKTTKTPTIVRSNVTPPQEKKVLTSSANLKKIIAPLPGNIISFKVSEGDDVNKGDVILIMEAMKMENNVLAESDGVVRNIKVKEGDTVLQGDILVEIE